MVDSNNLLDPALDISGSLSQKENLVQSEEPLKLGSRIIGQIGNNASIVNSGTTTISGLSGINSNSVGHYLSIFGAANSNNNGIFLIKSINSSTSVNIANALAVSDVNNGNISWIERNVYSLEDDLNYVRTDRSEIKGVSYYEPVPTYFKCDDSVTPVPANLSNIAGNTTDAKSFILTRKFENATVNDGYLYINLSANVGDFPYANSVNKLGVPIFDGYDSGNYTACYCEVIDPSIGSGLEVLSGIYIGNRIFGLSKQGLTGIDGNSFEVELRSVAIGHDLSTSIQYVWEIEQPNIVDVFFPFRECLAGMDENAFRTTLVNGLFAESGKGLNVKPTSVGQMLYCVDSADLIFTPAQPIVNDDGFIVTNEDGLILVY